MKRAFLVLVIGFVVAGCAATTDSSTTTSRETSTTTPASTTSGVTAKAGSQGTLPCAVDDGEIVGDISADVGNGMDRIPAFLSSAEFHPCDGADFAWHADGVIAGPADRALVTTDLDGIYIDADGLSGTDVTVFWESLGADGRSSEPFSVQESGEGRWDVDELPPPGEYVLHFSFRWTHEVGGLLGYTARVRIPDPLG